MHRMNWTKSQIFSYTFVLLKVKMKTHEQMSLGHEYALKGTNLKALYIQTQMIVTWFKGIWLLRVKIR